MNALTRIKIFTVGVWLGWMMTLGPLWGFLTTVIAMMRAFNSLDAAGISDPKALSSSVGMSLMGTATGLFMFPFGLGILLLSRQLRNQVRLSMPPPLPHFDGIDRSGV